VNAVDSKNGKILVTLYPPFATDM